MAERIALPPLASIKDPAIRAALQSLYDSQQKVAATGSQTSAVEQARLERLIKEQLSKVTMPEWFEDKVSQTMKAVEELTLPNSNAIDIIYQRNQTQPETPIGSETTPPIGWYTDAADVPDGLGWIWTSIGRKILSTDPWSWDTPVKMEGTDGVSGLSIAELTMYARSANPIMEAPYGGSYDFSTKELTVPTQYGVLWSPNIPTGTDPVYATKTTAAIQGTTGVVTLGAWAIPVVSFKDGEAYTLSIESTNGTIFRVGQAKQTTLVARIFKNGVDVTDQFPASDFRWTRVSMEPREPPYDDATWNAQYYQGYKQITISVDDVFAKATFHCKLIT